MQRITNLRTADCSVKWRGTADEELDLVGVARQREVLREDVAADKALETLPLALRLLDNMVDLELIWLALC